MPAHLSSGHTDEVFAAVFHPDGSRIASAGRDRVIRIWGPANGAELCGSRAHQLRLFAGLQPRRGHAGFRLGDYSVRLWDTFPVARRLHARAPALTSDPCAEDRATSVALFEMSYGVPILLIATIGGLLAAPIGPLRKVERSAPHVRSFRFNQGAGASRGLRRGQSDPFRRSLPDFSPAESWRCRKT